MPRILYSEAKKIFEKNKIGVVADGIGNTGIFYKLDRHRNIDLGGYTDMPPYKWTIATKWGLGKSNIGPYEITYLAEKKVDFEGCDYDRDKKEYVCDSEYVDMILKAKEELMKVLPELQKKSDEILEAFAAYRYSARVATVHHPTYTKKYGVTPPKWEGRVVWAGKEYVTEQKSSFKEAMTALNQLIETLQ